MVVINVNERTKAGKALIETARLMAQKFSGIEIIENDRVLLERMKANNQSDYLHEQEQTAFLNDLENLAGKRNIPLRRLLSWISTK